MGCVVLACDVRYLRHVFFNLCMECVMHKAVWCTRVWEHVIVCVCVCVCVCACVCMVSCVFVCSACVFVYMLCRCDSL
jgi:hypothetical protein